MQYAWQNIPFFCILLCIASASFTSVLPRRAARALCLAVILAVIVMGMALIGPIMRLGEPYTFMMGHFPAPWGNEIRVGLLEAVVGLVFPIIMLLALLGGLDRIDEHIFEDKQNFYYIMLELLLAALLAQVYTNDLFTAYVFVEIMTLSACSLITARSKGRTLVAATRYMIMNLMGSGLFLLGLSFLYGMTGHLLMGNIHEQVVLLTEAGSYPYALTVTVTLMSLGLCIKSALFPFHTWLPDAYGYSTPTSSAVLSSLVSKGYIFLLIKFFYRVIGMDIIVHTRITNILFVFGLVGTIMGSLSAIREKDIRRMVSFSSVAQIGYIYMGIGMGSEAGMVAAIFHIFVHGLAKSMLFLSTSGLVQVSGDSKLFRDLRGSGFRNPIAGVAFTVGSFSMVGIPFLGGFISKVYFAKAAMLLPMTKTIAVLLVLAASTVLNTIYFLKTVIT
ncbi:MAG: sodium:proton antiporter, partial [Clostridia bacterium]|nr:sodium:proton antiporter [Clostridia bacterium]